MRRIDFEKTVPYFDNGQFKWYYDNHFNNYINNEQAENLPKLEGMACFVVVGGGVEDYVLINDKQNILSSYPYTFEGFDQMTCKINIIKISKHFDKHEGNIV